MSSEVLTEQFTEQGREIQLWCEGLKEIYLARIFSEISPEHIAVFCADMINGFCKEGALASERVGAIARPISFLFVNLKYFGVNKFVLVQEWHDPHAKEFESFPKHGVMETAEAETIERLAILAFADKFIVFKKNSLSPAFSGLKEWLCGQDIRLAVVVGNCTDLCVRELAMFIRLWANEYQKDMRVIIPANCVQTFDLPFGIAQKIGAKPHPGDVYHMWALYEMSRNGIDVVKKVL